MSEWLNEWTTEWLSDCVSDWMNQWMSESVNKWTNKRMNDGRNDCMKEWMSERMNERQIQGWATSLLGYVFTEAEAVDKFQRNNKVDAREVSDIMEGLKKFRDTELEEVWRPNRPPLWHSPKKIRKGQDSNLRCSFLLFAGVPLLWASCLLWPASALSYLFLWAASSVVSVTHLFSSRSCCNAFATSSTIPHSRRVTLCSKSMVVAAVTLHL